MDNATLQAVKEAVGKHNEIGIIVGKNPNLDGMAAALSLYLGLKQLGKNVSVASPTEPIVELSSLVGIDKVKTNISQDAGDLIVSFPYREGEIEKVSYTLENGYLNIVVKAGPQGLSFAQNDVKYKRQGSLPTLLFVVATPRLSDLGSLFDPEALKNTTVVNIDNKVENQGFGEIVTVSPKFSSVSEMVSDLLLGIGVSIDVDIAQNLLSGISHATNNFQDQKTSYLAFEMAGVLMQKGAVRVQKDRARGDESFFKPRVGQQMPSRQAMPQGDFPPPMSQATAQQRFGGPSRQFPKKPQQFPRQSQQSNDAASRLAGQSQPVTSQVAPKDEGEEPPSDWLTPKVYKGSTNLS